ncbi:MAG: hypothetical protein IKQ18_01025, partial [Clostridia bacterium]|nr:hypothetical protein [Clostridia bacterium]
DVMLYGRGAGSIPTAAAVLSDIAEALSGRAEVLEWKRVKNGSEIKTKKRAFVICEDGAKALSEFKVIKKASDGEYGAYLINDASGIEETDGVKAVYDVVE